jgi:hypothetical protein
MFSAYVTNRCDVLCMLCGAVLLATGEVNRAGGRTYYV